ncbi:hypothetical protein GGS20DRAFT_363662 [Poronia punctata]|nr:hypothetical protein GGS20DRAFT_363662 [Poronia punctata]
MSLFLSEADEDEDDLSITSTDLGDGDADKEWLVDCVLAERPHPEQSGAMQYLIKWDGFELEHSTWEPLHSLGEGLLAQWEAEKAMVEAGTRRPFDISLYENACLARAYRHERRNAKRQRLGFPMTPPFPPGYEEETFLSSPVTDSSSVAEDEMEETDDVDRSATAPSRPGEETTVGIDSSTSAPPSAPSTDQTTVPKGPTSIVAESAATLTSQKVVKQKIFRGIPSPATQKGQGSSSTTHGGQSSRPRSPSSKAPTNNSVSASSSIQKPVPVRKGPAGTLTGYQGTARRSSLFAKQTARKTANPLLTMPNKPPATSNAARPLPPAHSTLPPKPPSVSTIRRPSDTSGVNVFAGGKPPRKNARKSGNERGEAAGAALSSIPTKFLIGDGEENSRRPSLNAPTAAGPPQLRETRSPVDGAPALPTSAAKPQAPVEPKEHKSAEQTPTLKPKKSVHFTEGTKDTMSKAVDDPPNDAAGKRDRLEGPTVVNKSAAPPALMGPPKRPNLTIKTDPSQGQLQLARKRAKFGATPEVLVNFAGVCRQAESWVVAFNAHETLDFKTTSTYFHFYSQRSQLIAAELSAGVVQPVAPEHAAALGKVATNLERDGVGLHCLAQTYSIIVYPAQSNKWEWVDTHYNFRRDPSSESSLRYFIYRAPPHLTSRSYPSEYRDDQAPFNHLINPNGSRDPDILGVLTGLDFNRFLPQDLTMKDKQVYMLLIPLGAQQVMRVVKAWLRLNAPGRPIFTIDEPNSWRSFHDMVDDGCGGTIVSHWQFTMFSLEKLRGVWRMLESRKYTFWTLDTGEHKTPQYPSDLRAKSYPGLLRMVRLFPYGRAFLITPSFALSEPAKLCSFLRWFKRYAVNPGHIIVTCHRFPQYLQTIAEEKEVEHRLSVAEGIKSDVDVESYIRAWELLTDLMDTFGDEETGIDVRKFHWLYEFIDPNDEQSLVSAFCLWASLKMDMFRRFYVLGSDPAMVSQAWRVLQIPRYAPTDSSDPDTSGVLVMRNSIALQQQQEADERGTEVNIAWGTGAVLDEKGYIRIVGEWRNSIATSPFPFPGRIFRTDTPAELHRWIEQLRARTKGNWCELHAKPVAWRDWSMAAQFGDGDETGRRYDTFGSWISAAPSFTKLRNTWIGLFYTITDEWDEYLPKRQYERHPWVAIYRPKNPASRVFQKPVPVWQTELFIWDVAANERGKYGDSLLDMQRQLVDVVKVESERRHPKCVLTDVWHGSANHVVPEQGENVLDLTCTHIQRLFDESRVELPSHPAAVAERWSCLDPRVWKDGLSPMTRKTKPLANKPSELKLRQIPQTQRDLLKPERMVFHPGNGNNGAHRTKCLNHLYETCLRARRANPDVESIIYRYRPTREWWEDWIKEGRAYGFINVDAASSIIKRLPSSE